MKARLYFEDGTLALEIEVPGKFRVITWGTKDFSHYDVPNEPPEKYRESIVLCCKPENYYTLPSGIPGEPTEVRDIDWDNF